MHHESTTIVVLIVLTLTLTLTHAAAFTSCFLYRGDVSDLTFTYSFNVARIAAHAQLINDVNVELQSNAYADFELVVNATSRLESLIADDGCGLIVTTWPGILATNLTAFAAQHPSVYFVERTSGVVRGVGAPANYANYVVQFYQNLFMAGAVAAAMSSTCVGLIYPTYQRSWEANAFYRGFLWANMTTPLFTVAMDADGSSVSEQSIIDLFVARGCKVIASTTVNNILPNFVASLPASSSILSVGYGADSSLTAGDSVLTSIYTDLEQLFYNVTMDAIAATLRPTYMVRNSSDLILTDVSPRAPSSVVTLASAARAFADRTDIGCFTFVDEGGVTHAGCLNETQKSSFPHLDARIHRMRLWRPPSVCPAGTYYLYDAIDFSVSCVPCAAGYYARASGSPACVACASGLTSSPGSASCYIPSNASFQKLLIIPMVVGGLVALVLCAAVLISCLRVKIPPSVDPRNAPRGPQLALAMIGVDGARSDRQWRSSLTNMCDVYDRLSGIITPVANAHKGYIFLSVGDVVMIAMDDANSLLHLLADIHKRADVAPWPCHIRLKMAMHVGTPQIAEHKARRNHDDDVRIAYSGSEVDMTRTLWRREHSCDVMMTEHCAKLLAREDELFTLGDVFKFSVPDKDVGVDAVALTFLIAQASSEAVAVNPLSLAPFPLEGDTDSRRGISSGASETSENVDDDLVRLVTPSVIKKEELDAVRTLGVDMLQKFLRVFSFDDQVSIVNAIAKKLHVQAPKIPEMKTSAKKSFNVLRNSLKQICNQLLMSMDELELHAWLDAVAAHVHARDNASAPPLQQEDDQQGRPLLLPQQ